MPQTLFPVLALSLAVALVTGAPPATARAPAPNAAPRIGGMLYPDARRLLIRSGWTPVRVAADPRDNPDLGFRGDDVAAAGFREAVYCSDVGLAFCMFRYHNRSDRLLEVTTAGEEVRESRVYSVTFHDCRARPRPEGC